MMLDGQETELEIIDHPASEMSVSKTRRFSVITKITEMSERSGVSRGQLPNKLR